MREPDLLHSRNRIVSSFSVSARPTLVAQEDLHVSLKSGPRAVLPHDLSEHPDFDVNRAVGRPQRFELFDIERLRWPQYRLGASSQYRKQTLQSSAILFRGADVGC